MCRLLTAVIILLSAPLSAFGQTILTTAEEGVLRPGLPNRVLVAALDFNSLPASEPPSVAIADGRGVVSYLGRDTRGVFAYQLIPGFGVKQITLRTSFEEKVSDHVFTVEPLPVSRLNVPSRLVGEAGNSGFEFLISGDDLPSPEALQVSVGEGSVERVERIEGGLKVRLALLDSPFPRVVALGVRDARKRERPRWATLRLRAHPRLPLEVEPGSQAQFAVGNRTYGPFEADESGRMVARVDQYPGERAAEVTVVDALGNETQTNVPLPVHYQASIGVMVSGPQTRSGGAPTVFVHAVDGDGRAWNGEAPRCRSPKGTVKLYTDLTGQWMFSLPKLSTESLDEQRIVCSVTRDAVSTIRVPVARAAGGLRVRIWPEELAADFPMAEFQVALEDLRGERISAEGVQVSAGRGEVRLFERSDSLIRGEYDGSALLDGVTDTLHVRYDALPAEGFVDRIELGYASDGLSDEVDVFARLLNVDGAPVQGIPVRLNLNGVGVEARSGEHGWAVARLPIAATQDVFAVKASTKHRQFSALGVRGGRSAYSPGSPDIVVKRDLEILPGAVEGIEVSVDPPIMYIGQRATAFIRILFLDRVGIPVVDEAVTVEASEGKVGEMVRQADGSFVAEFQPESTQTPRTVSITARMESSGRSATTRLELQPSPVNGAIGFNAGLLTNFNKTRPVGNLVLDWRTPLLENTVMLRFGVGQTWEIHSIPTAVGADSEIKLLYYPVELGMLLRRDDGGRAFWLGAVGTVWPYWAEVRFGADVVGEGFGVVPGAALISGVGWRLGFGEMFLEARGYAVSQPGGDLNYGGNAGGLAAGLGYRVVY